MVFIYIIFKITVHQVDSNLTQFQLKMKKKQVNIKFFNSLVDTNKNKMRLENHSVKNNTIMPKSTKNSNVVDLKLTENNESSVVNLKPKQSKKLKLILCQ